VNKIVNMKSRGKLGIDSGVIGRGSGVGGGPRSIRTGSPRSGATFTRKKGFSTLLSKKSSLLYRETLLAKHGKMNDTPSQRARGHGVCTHTGWEVEAAPGSSYSGAKLKVKKSSFA
jgi:hypothetical protein